MNMENLSFWVIIILLMLLSVGFVYHRWKIAKLKKTIAQKKYLVSEQKQDIFRQNKAICQLIFLALKNKYEMSTTPEISCVETVMKSDGSVLMILESPSFGQDKNKGEVSSELQEIVNSLGFSPQLKVFFSLGGKKDANGV
ncbi:MAG: hypothetical protein R3B41_01660 [Candidatus Doudnabacteria bacterium]